MNIYILRHGKAEEAGGKRDALRDLTPEGIESLKASLPGMKKLIGAVDFILSSPLHRASQTAKLVADYFKCPEYLEGADVLAQPGKEDAILKRINRFIGKENIVVVGHQPYLGQLILRMIPPGGLSEEDAHLKKGGLAKVVYKGFIVPHEGRLEWIKTPKELRGLQ